VQAAWNAVLVTVAIHSVPGNKYKDRSVHGILPFCERGLLIILLGWKWRVVVALLEFVSYQDSALPFLKWRFPEF
jgi:hypothetical protein